MEASKGMKKPLEATYQHLLEIRFRSKLQKVKIYFAIFNKDYLETILLLNNIQKHTYFVNQKTDLASVNFY